MCLKAQSKTDSWSSKQVVDGEHSMITQNSRFCIPDEISLREIQWHYGMLAHPGATLSHKTLIRPCYIKGLRGKISNLVRHYSARQKRKDLSASMKNSQLSKLMLQHEFLCAWIQQDFTTVAGDKNLRCLTTIGLAACWAKMFEVPRKTVLRDSPAIGPSMVIQTPSSQSFHA